ncbi:MAG: hypothetical protein QM726_19720 [Chitinophagaceae bacterium]
MNKLLLKRITIFLSVDAQTIDSYFNPHDPSPIYKRQLNQDFESYIMSSIVAIKRYSEIRYKLVCNTVADEQYVEPLVHAIRRHFSIQKSIKESEFLKFKKSSYKLLAFSLAVVMFCQFFLITLIKGNENLHSMLGNAVEVFSWVILWKPIDKLIFYWNPYLKEISILDRLMNAEIVISNRFSSEMTVPEKKYA